MKKKICIIITVVMIITVVICAFLIQRSAFSLKIDGKKVDKQEYLDMMNQEINEVSQYFYEKSGITLNKASWEQDFNGEIPYQVLTDRTVERLKYMMSVYGLAVEKGYVEGEGFADLKERMEAENQAREEKKKNGEPIYGLSSFSLKLFTEYEMDALQKKYCEDLNNEGMQISEKEQKAYYEENKERFFAKDDDIALDYVMIPYDSEGLTQEQVVLLKEKLTGIYKKSGKESGLKELVKHEEDLEFYLDHLDLKSAESASYAKIFPELLEYAGPLKKGEWTQVIDNGGSLYLIECVDRTEHHFYEIEEVIDNINKALREKHYNALIQERVDAVETEANMERIYIFTKKNINE